MSQKPLQFHRLHCTLLLVNKSFQCAVVPESHLGLMGPEVLDGDIVTLLGVINGDFGGRRLSGYLFDGHGRGFLRRSEVHLFR